MSLPKNCFELRKASRVVAECPECGCCGVNLFVRSVGEELNHHTARAVTVAVLAYLHDELCRRGYLFADLEILCKQVGDIVRGYFARADVGRGIAVLPDDGERAADERFAAASVRIAANVQVGTGRDGNCAVALFCLDGERDAAALFL